jgi:hypothetical protein
VLILSFLDVYGGANMFAMAIVTTISYSSGRQYGPVLIQIFLDVFNSADMFVMATGTTISSSLGSRTSQCFVYLS